MPAQKQHTVGIVGGGITGLCAGFALQQRGFACTVYEKGAAPGGVIRTHNEGGWLVELGPNTLMAKSQKVWNLIEALDLGDAVVRAGAEAKKRFIVKNGVPQPIPTSLMDFFRSDLLSAGAKLRLLKEPFVNRSNGNTSVASFFEQRLGSEVADYLVNPFIAGIYAGDPRSLSVKHTFSSLFEMEQQHGSLLKGALFSARKKKRRTDPPAAGGLISFRQGLRQLTGALASRLESALKLESVVTGIAREGERWSLELNGASRSIPHDALIYTAPLHRLTDIRCELERPAPSMLEELAGLRYAPVATVALGFERSHVEHPLDGFGVLAPEAENRTVLGCLFSSSLFENRAPESHLLLTSFVGGERNPDLVDIPDARLGDLVLEDLRTLLGITGEPRFVQIHKWQHAIPQFGLEHQSQLDRMEALEEANPGLYLTGNFRNEVSLPGCIEQAYETSDRVASFLKS
ncbi:MAG: protoporphyrinogen oxidase [Balneolaceae bacterium]|nr:protoporphyrinogen oxidase [Balneolaceae bacterium]